MNMNLRWMEIFSRITGLAIILTFRLATRAASLPIDDRNDNTRSLDDLLSDFRFEQLYLSNTMINESRHLQLPVKMAQAEVEESEERKAKAFRGKSEAMTPFIATTSRLNVGYIGRGYDIYHGNPLSEDGVVDQGFRLPIIDLPFSFRFTSDGEYRIPDNVDVISEPSASFSSSFVQVTSESDYRSMLNADVSVNAHASGYGLKGSFSASASYHRSQQQIQKGQTTSLNTIGRSVVYKTRLSSTASVSKVSDFFESAVKSLPVDHCEEDVMQEQYSQFIEEFGTHYTTEVMMGAKAIQQLVFKKSELDKLSAEGISAKVAAEVSYDGFGVSAGGGISASVGTKENQRNKVANTNKQQKEYYIGGSPPSGNIGTGQGSTETLREWARSSSENPVPIQYKISSIENLLNPSYFKDLTYGFYERRKCMRKALLTHCMNTINPALCDAQTGSNRRNKRDTDEVEHISTLKYGDFVKLKNKDRFLVVSNKYGMVKGTAVKMLNSANQFKNYEGLFQVIPLEEQENKMATDIHYGEAFTLRTRDGEKLSMGRRFIPDIEEPSEARLMDLFEDNNEERRVNRNREDVQDFAVFHQERELATYLVSLRVETNCYGNRNSKVEFRVQLNGADEGISTKVTTECMCSKRSCRIHRWFHSIIVEPDIKEIKSVELLKLQELGGKFTQNVKEIQIKSLFNGKLQRYIKEGLQCCEIICNIRLKTPETRGIGLDTYPIQFAFHSKRYPQNQPVVVSDVGYIHVLSSFPKKSYWGNEVSHLLSIDDMDMVAIKEKEPGQHESLSGNCTSIIYPSTAGLVTRHDTTDYIIVSFDVTVMVNFIEVETTKTLDLNVLNIAIIDRRTEKFVNVSPKILHRENNTTKLTFGSTNYTTAVKLFPKSDTSSNLSDIKMVLIGGCRGALTRISDDNPVEEEWEIGVSENEIQQYPFLKVVPKVQPVDIDTIYQALDAPKELFKTIISLNEDKAACHFEDEFFREFLTAAKETAELKYDQVIVNKTTTTTSSSGSKEHILLHIQLAVTGLTKKDLDKRIVYLNDTLRKAIAAYPCETSHSLQSSIERLTAGSGGTSKVVVYVITCICGALVILVIVFVYLVHRLKLKIRYLKGKQSKDTNSR